ncbi:MAG: DUF421 domain-containing protein [Firmicutes bacterium]|nr:DUF421 domain-containing protein [Bacillota bacterium]
MVILKVSKYLVLNIFLIIINNNRNGQRKRGNIILKEAFIVVYRTILALVILFASTKILTKRSLSKLTYFDYLAVATLGTLAGNLAFNIKIKVEVFLISIFVVTVIVYIASYISLKSQFFRKFFAGEKTVLIQDGKILEKNMKNIKYTYEYLNQQLRQQKVFDINKVEHAIIEPNGELSVKLKAKNEPVTPKDLNIQTNCESLAIELILDGKIIDKNLKEKNLSKVWIKNELKNRGILNIKEVSYGVLSSKGKLFIDLYKDQM